MHTRRKGSTSLPLAVAGAAVATVAQVASWLFARPVAPHPIDAERRTLSTRAGALLAYEDARAATAPVLLLHATGTTGCTYEVAGLFEALRADRTVVAVELPGYAEGAATTRREDASLAAVVADVIEELALRHREHVDVVAAGSTGLAASEAAARLARHVRSLVLLSPPPGGGKRLVPRALAVAARRALGAALRLPALGPVLFRLTTSRLALELDLRLRTKELPHGLVHHAWVAARQHGAHRARLAAALRTPAAATLPAVPVPTLVVLGAGEVPDGMLRSPLATPGRTLAVIPDTHAMPHVERPAETAAAIASFWASRRRRPELRLVRGSGRGPRTPLRRASLRDVAPERRR